MLQRLFSNFFGEKSVGYDRLGYNNRTFYRQKIGNAFIAFGKEWGAFILKLEVGCLTLKLTLNGCLPPRFYFDIEPSYFFSNDSDPAIVIEKLEITACFLGCGVLVLINFPINEDD